MSENLYEIRAFELEKELKVVKSQRDELLEAAEIALKFVQRMNDSKGDGCLESEYALRFAIEGAQRNEKRSDEEPYCPIHGKPGPCISHQKFR